MTTIQENGVRAATVLRHTEIGRGSQFVNTIQDSHSFVADTNKWHKYEKGCWAPVDQRLFRVGRWILSKMKQPVSREWPSGSRRDDCRVSAANKAGVNNLTHLASVELLAKAEDFDPMIMPLCH